VCVRNICVNILHKGDSDDDDDNNNNSVSSSPTGGGRSVGIVRSRTKATEFVLFIYIYIVLFF
jgi:hypothetical protein